jgi:hypothetical protein
MHAWLLAKTKGNPSLDLYSHYNGSSYNRGSNYEIVPLILNYKKSLRKLYMRADHNLI